MKCVYETDFDGKDVCGHCDSDCVQTTCVPCHLMVTKEEACEYMDRCGHSGDGANGCKKDVYCSYRHIRFNK